MSTAQQKNDLLAAAMADLPVLPTQIPEETAVSQHAEAMKELAGVWKKLEDVDTRGAAGLIKQVGLKIFGEEAFAEAMVRVVR